MKEKFSPTENEKELSIETRRKFLTRSLEAVAGAVVAAKSLEAQEPVSELEGIVRRSSLDLIRAREQKVDFPEKGQEMPPALRTILGNIMSLQNTLETARIEKINVIAVSNALEPVRRFIWESLRQFLPEASGTFSNETLNHVLAHNLPSLLAKYNVLAKVKFIFLQNEKGVPFSPGDAFMSFYYIERKESDTVTRQGRTFQRNIIELDQAFDTGIVAVSPQTLTMGAFTEYGSAFIYKPVFEQEFQLIEKQMKDFSALDAMRDEELVRHFQNTGKGVDAVLLAVAAKLFRTIKKRGNIREQFKESTKEHETGHIADQVTGNLLNHFPMLESMTLAELKKVSTNRSIHAEINGSLYDLRYSNSKSMGLIGIISSSQTVEVQDIYHAQGGRWLTDQLVGEVLRERSRFHIAIEKRKGMPPRDQALFALVDMAEEDPQAIEKIAERIMTFHEEHYDEDLSTAYGIKNTAYPSSVILVSPEEIRNIGIGTGVTVAAGYALHKLLQRKNKIAASRNGKSKKK